MSISTTLTNDLKVKFRKVKTVPAKVKAAIYIGCIDMNALQQFHKDVSTYGLYEALLFVENYEADGFYKQGTALNASKHLK